LPTPENEIKLTFAESSQEPSSSTPEVGLNIEVPHEPVPSLEIQTNRADSSVAENTFPPLEENPHPTDIPPPKIQPASRRIKSQTRELIIWEPKILQNGKDPLGKGITLIMQKGASCALFLAISPPPPGAPPAPHFLATAAVMPNDKLTIWTGLKWDPTVVPEMWNFFIKSGSVELSPPGTQTALTSARNVVRAAFGIRQSEWLLLVRVGPINACRGVLAFVSKESLQTKLAEALPFLSASEQKIK